MEDGNMLVNKRFNTSTIKLFSVLVFLIITSKALAFDPVIVVFGGPGSGKGTFSQTLKRFRGYHHICAGDIVRREIDLQTPIGKEIEIAISEGNHVVCEAMDRLIEDEVIKVAKQGNPIILDGFVHTQNDWDSLCRLIDLLEFKSRIFIFHLYANDSICEQRIMNRLVCPQCHYVYNLDLAPPKSFGICNFCEAKLKQRINDDRRVILKRIQDYEKNSFCVFQNAIKDFPCINFETNKSLEECVEIYLLIADEVEIFSGSNYDLVNIINDKYLKDNPQAAFIR